MAFIEDDGNIGIKRKAESVLTLEDGSELGTLDYFDVHRKAKVKVKPLRINCTITEIFCHEYDGFSEGKYFPGKGSSRRKGAGKYVVRFCSCVFGKMAWLIW